MTKIAEICCLWFKIFLQQKEQTSLLARLRETNDFLMVEDKKVQPCDKERETENKVSALLIQFFFEDMF